MRQNPHRRRRDRQRLPGTCRRPLRQLLTATLILGLFGGGALAVAGTAQAASNGQQIRFCSRDSAVSGRPGGSAVAVGIDDRDQPRTTRPVYLRGGGECEELRNLWFKGIVRIEWRDAAGKLVKTTRCAVPVNKISPWINCDDIPVHTQLLNWMSAEVAKNLRSSVFQEIQRSYPALATPKSLQLWALQVRPGGPWDHKPFIERDFLGSSYSRENGRLYFQWYDRPYLLSHDFWSNFHYGYVGRAAGFKADVLRYAHQLPGTGGTDSGDKLAVDIGIAYFNKFGKIGVYPATLDSFLSSYLGKLLGTGVARAIPYLGEAPVPGTPGPTKPAPDAPQPGNNALTTWVSVLTPSGGVGPKVLDVKDGALTDGARVQLWQRNGNSQQYWTIERKGTHQGHPYYRLVNRNSGKCLDMATDVPAGNGVRVQQWRCNGTPNQYWVAVPVESSGSRAKWVELVNLQSGRCLDVTGVNHGDGALLQVWDCRGGWNQRFNIY